MDFETLKGFGQIAGIGGLSLGVFFLLFRDVIRKNVFSKMSQANSYRLMRQLLFLVWSIAILGIGVWAVLQLRSPQSEENSVPVNGSSTVIQTGDGSQGAILNNSQGVIVLESNE